MVFTANFIFLFFFSITTITTTSALHVGYIAGSHMESGKAWRSHRGCTTPGIQWRTVRNKKCLEGREVADIVDSRWRQTYRFDYDRSRTDISCEFLYVTTWLWLLSFLIASYTAF